MNKAAQELGRLGGKARALSMTKEELRVVGRKGGLARAKKLTKARRSEIARTAGKAKQQITKEHLHRSGRERTLNQ